MPGFPGRPMSRAEVERKFRTNAGTRWPKQRTDAILQAFWALERAEDAGGLLAMLALQT